MRDGEAGDDSKVDGDGEGEAQEDDDGDEDADPSVSPPSASCGVADSALTPAAPIMAGVRGDDDEGDVEDGADTCNDVGGGDKEEEGKGW